MGVLQPEHPPTLPDRHAVILRCHPAGEGGGGCVPAGRGALSHSTGWSRPGPWMCRSGGGSAPGTFCCRSRHPLASFWAYDHRLTGPSAGKSVVQAVGGALSDNWQEPGCFALSGPSPQAASDPTTAARTATVPVQRQETSCRCPLCGQPMRRRPTRSSLHQPLANGPR